MSNESHLTQIGSLHAEGGREKHRPMLCVCGVRARTSTDSRDALLFACSLLGMVSKQASVDSATRGENTRRTDVHG